VLGVGPELDARAATVGGCWAGPYRDLRAARLSSGTVKAVKPTCFRAFVRCCQPEGDSLHSVM
jgi:hypothetical protein